VPHTLLGMRIRTSAKAKPYDAFVAARSNSLQLGEGPLQLTGRLRSRAGPRPHCAGRNMSRSPKPWATANHGRLDLELTGFA
jgi:hypothetical protein